MIPQWIIAVRTTHHSSIRQPKMVRPDWIKEYYRQFNNQPRERMRIQGASAPVQQFVTNGTKLVPARSGALHLNEYRFWRASDGGGCCRRCFRVINTPKARIEHQKANGCTRVLTEAYKLLLRDHICTVCDVKTHKTLWGIPLCSNPCVYRWQFETGAGMYTVQLAIKLYESQTGNGLVTKAPQPTIL